MKQRGLIICLLYIVTVSCNNKKVTPGKLTSHKRKFDSLMTFYRQPILNKPYLLIQVDGCPSCVDKGIAFLKKHVNDTRINFVLTAESGDQPIRAKLSQEELTSTNILVDHHSSFIRAGLVKGYLALLMMEDEEMLERKVLDPETVEAELKLLDNELKEK